jgi:peptidyl-tRNA hydrolase
MEKRLNETNRMRKLMDLPLITERVRDTYTDADVEYLSALKAAIEGPGTNEEKVYEVLGKLNKEELDKIDTYFRKNEGESVRDFILGDFSGEELNKVKNMLDKIG